VRRFFDLISTDFLDVSQRLTKLLGSIGLLSPPIDQPPPYGFSYFRTEGKKREGREGFLVRLSTGKTTGNTSGDFGGGTSTSVGVGSTVDTA
jgi:hypothetical protein